MLEDKKETLTPTPTVVAKPLSPKESVVNKQNLMIKTWF